MPFFTATLVTALALIAAPPITGESARIALTEDGLVWLRRGESLKRIDMDGHRVPASVPAIDGKLLDFAVSPDGETLFRLLESKGKISTLAAHAASSGAELGRWEIRTLGRSLTMAPDGTSLALLGLRPRAGRRPRVVDWTLAVLNIVTGEMTQPRSLGHEPRGVSIFGNAAGRPVLFLATDDRILTYTLSPMRASRFYNSPGKNVAIAGTEHSPVLHVLRDSVLAVIDPSLWSRAGGRIQLASDDATSIVPLGSPGIAFALSGDGSVAFVLHEDRRTLSVVDTGSAAVIDTRMLDGERDLMAGPTADGRIVLASSALQEAAALMTISTPPATGLAERAPPAKETEPAPAPEPPPAPVEPETGVPEPESRATPVPETVIPQEAEPVPEPPPAPEPPRVSETEPLPVEPPPDVVPPEKEAAPEPPPVPETEPEPEPVVEPGIEPVQEDVPPDPPPTEEAVSPEHDPPEPAPPVEKKMPRESVSGPGLSGSIAGNFDVAKEVLLYGPDNLLRLAARAAVAADGTFRFELPPPGSYRVIVSAGPDGQIFTNPRFRMIVVEKGGAGSAELDFEIVGQL